MEDFQKIIIFDRELFNVGFEWNNFAPKWLINYLQVQHTNQADEPVESSQVLGVHLPLNLYMQLQRLVHEFFSHVEHYSPVP